MIVCDSCSPVLSSTTSSQISQAAAEETLVREEIDEEGWSRFNIDMRLDSESFIDWNWVGGKISSVVVVVVVVAFFSWVTLFTYVLSSFSHFYIHLLIYLFVCRWVYGRGSWEFLVVVWWPSLVGDCGEVSREKIKHKSTCWSSSLNCVPVCLRSFVLLGHTSLAEEFLLLVSTDWLW